MKRNYNILILGAFYVGRHSATLDDTVRLVNEWLSKNRHPAEKKGAQPAPSGMSFAMGISA